MNIKTARDQMGEASRLLKQAQDLLGGESVTDEQRTEAKMLTDRARQMRADAEAMREIENEIKGAVREAEAQASAVGTSAADEFKSFGEFLQAVVEANQTGARGADARLHRFVDDTPGKGKKALAGTQGATGGFLMPEQFLPDIQAAIVEGSTVLGSVMRLPMAARTVTLPVVDYTVALPAGEPRQFGGVQAFYDDEGALLEESEPRFREFTLTAHELTVYTEANNSLLQDAAISLDAFLKSDMGMVGAARWKTDYKILRGTGVGQPLGILNSPATIAVTRSGSNAVTYADLANMEQAAMPSAKLEWRATINLRATLRQLVDGDGRLIWADAQSGMPATLMGYPIRFTEKLPSKGTSGDILLADFSYYMFGERQAMTLDVSDQANFRRNRTAYRLITRHDGRPWMNAPLTLSDGSTQLSPFVVLTT